MRQRGSVFVMALIALTAITTILAITVSAQRVSFHATLNRMEGRRARDMAESGVQRAMTELQLLTSTAEVDQLQEWYVLGNAGGERFTVGDDSFRVQVVDAASLINLNTAPEEQLLNLGLTQAQVDSLLDWREAGDTPRTEGAKDEYYNGLQRPYNSRKGRLESLDEVLLIKDWLPTTLYDTPTNATGITAPRPLSECATVDSFSPNTSGTGGQMQNINTAQAQQLTQAGLSQQVATAIVARRNGLGQFTSMNQVFQTPGIDQRSAGVLLDGFTTSTGQRAEGKLNLNTVTEDVLQSLPGVTPDIASGIVSQQASGFTALSSILQVPGVTVQLLGQIADLFRVGSDTFIVRCEGRSGSSVASIEVIVQMVNNNPVVLRTVDPPQNDMAARWGWADTATSDTVIGEDKR